MDRRRELRRAVFVAVQMEAMHWGALAVTRDLSAEGALLLARKRLEVGDRIRLRMALPEAEAALDAEVVRVAKPPSDGLWRYALGVRFLRRWVGLSPIPSH
jgi:PilZ domain